MFVDLITSLAYQLKIGGIKMRTCQEILKMVFSASTVIQASVQSLTRERSQFGDPLLSQKDLGRASCSSHDQTVCRVKKGKALSSLSLEPGDHFSALPPTKLFTSLLALSPENSLHCLL